jgi:hypothetical protein
MTSGARRFLDVASALSAEVIGVNFSPCYQWKHTYPEVYFRCELFKETFEF